MAQSQKEFEAKFPMPKNCTRCGDGYAPTSYSAWEAQEYVALWKGWQASRQSLVVELPKIHFDAYADERTQAKEEGKEIILDEFKYSLEQAGVTYK